MPALLTFANGQQSTTVTLGSSGSESVLVRSTGQMGRYFNDHQLGSIAVAINAKGITRHISLLTEQNYQQLAIQYLENVYTGTPPPLAAGPGEQLLNIIIPTAHAGLFDDIWDGVVGVVEFLIPIEAMGEVVTQLSLLAQNSPLFDPSKLIFSSLELLTIFPIARPLAPLLKASGKMGGPLINVFNRFKHYNTLKYLADYVGQATKAVVNNRNFDKFVILMPFFITVGEMYVENPESVEIMLKSIGSAADLEAWISYLFLPMEEEAAQLAYNYMGNPWQTQTSQFASVMDFVVSPAQAKPSKIFKIISGDDFSKALVIAAQKAVAPLAKDPRIFSKVFAEAYETVRRKGLVPLTGHISYVRNYLHDKNTIAALASIGTRTAVGKVRAFIKDANRRIGFLETVALVGYLESRRDVFEDQNVNLPSEIDKLLARAFYMSVYEADVKNAKQRQDKAVVCPEADREKDEGQSKKKDFNWGWAYNKSSGAIYHLSQIAILDAQGETITEIEGRKEVLIKAGTSKYPRIRVVDIVLETDGSDDNAKWVEVKFYQRDWKGLTNAYQNKLHTLQRPWDSIKKPKLNDKGVYSMVTENTSERRQFFLDRIHATTDGFETRMQWRFHDFTIKGKGSCKNGDDVHGLAEKQVAWIRSNVFKPLPSAMSALKKRRLTFGVADQAEWLIYDGQFDGKLKDMVISAGHMDLLSGAKFKDLVPEIVEVTSK